MRRKTLTLCLVTDDVYFYECDLAVQAEIEATVLKIQEEVRRLPLLFFWHDSDPCSR